MHREGVLGLDEGLAALGRPVTLQLEAIRLELALGRTDAALTRLRSEAARAKRKESWLVRIGEIQASSGQATPTGTARVVLHWG